MRVAAKVAQEKQAHPERFCATPRCLWRVTHQFGVADTPCPKHGVCATCGYPLVSHPRMGCHAIEGNA